MEEEKNSIFIEKIYQIVQKIYFFVESILFFVQNIYSLNNSHKNKRIQVL